MDEVAATYSQESLHLFAQINHYDHLLHTANEGPVKIQYIYLVPIYVFPEIKLLFPKQNYNVLAPSSYTHILYM